MGGDYFPSCNLLLKTDEGHHQGVKNPKKQGLWLVAASQQVEVNQGPEHFLDGDGKYLIKS